MERRRDEGEWELTYPYWASSAYSMTALAGLAASLATPLVFPAATGWGLDALLDFFAAEGAAGFGFGLALAAAMLLLAVPPAMLSLFLLAVSDTRLRLHPLIGAGFFALWTGWLMQSVTGALFGLIFGAVSVGGIAAMLGLRRRFDRRR